MNDEQQSPRKKKQVKEKPVHQAADFGLDIVHGGDDDMFRWFLLAYLFGKPIQSKVAAQTWDLFIYYNLDTPWAIRDLPKWELVSVLDEGRYTRYDTVMADALQKCMTQLINLYEGSLMYMFDISENEDQFSKQLQTLFGVGPKTAEIFMRETEELFARRVE